MLIVSVLICRDCKDKQKCREGNRISRKNAPTLALKPSFERKNLLFNQEAAHPYHDI
jgi:formaldehyde-activating enzyme involved in methanogenesis